MLFPRKSISDPKHAWKPGNIAENSCCSHRRTYPIGMSGMECDSTLIRFTPVGAPPAVPSPEWCGANCENGAKGIVITVHYPNCCIDGIDINIPYPAEGEDLGGQLLCYIRESQIAGLGAFGWDAANNTLNFRNRFQGFPVEFSVTTDASVYDVCIKTSGQSEYSGKRDRIVAGTAVVSAPLRQMDDEIAAFVPSQDVNADGATECWLGVAVCTESAGEKAPVVNPKWPNFNSCDENCGPEPECIQIAGHGDIVYVELEQPHKPEHGCKLYYRYQPDLDNGLCEPGFSPVAGPGLAEVPMNVLFMGTRGNVSKIQFG